MRSIVSSLFALLLFMGCSAESEQSTSKKSETTKNESVTKGEAAAKSEVKKERSTDEGVFAHMYTNMGLITIALEFEKTPLTVANFVGLAEGTKNNTAKKAGEPYYDGIIFHRIIKNFMIQGGDPTGTGRGGPGYSFDDEFDPSLTHSGAGILSMANAGPGTNGSQFFITHKATPHLNNRHTVFGSVVKGMDVVDAIANVQVGQRDMPVTPVVIDSVRIRRSGEAAENFAGDQSHFEAIEAEKKAAAAKAAEVKFQEMEAQVKVKFPEATKSPFGNFFVVSQQKGSGALPEPNTKVEVHYTGSLLENGREFDSSVKRGTPFSFVVGAGQVIKGWDIAVSNMKKGEKNTIILPPELGYGARGAGGVIPPNAWLVFEVELLNF